MVRQIKGMSEFNQVLSQAGSKPVLVDFFAVWCPPCQMIAPELERLAAHYSGMLFLKVDVEQAADIADEYEIEAYPTFKVFKNKQVIDTMRGGNAQKLEDMIRKYAK